MAPKPKKKSSKAKNRKAAAASARQSFSPTQKGGSPSPSCPAKNPIPCNLAVLKLNEPEAEIGGEEGTRSAEIRKGQALDRAGATVKLPPGGKFQITAPSSANDPREIEVSANPQCMCSGSKHPELAVSDKDGARSVTGTKTTLGFWRGAMATDSGLPGLWVVVNAIRPQRPVSYPLSALTCGVPSSGPPVASLATVIQVYPADQYEFEVELPALLEPESLSYETQSQGWKTLAQQKEEESGEAEEEFTPIESINSTDSGAKFKTEMDKGAKTDADEDDESFVEEISVSLTQTDGTRTLEAPIDDMVKVVRAIRNAEYALKQIQEWADDLQFGPGVSFKLECQFLVGHFNAEWGYTEYTDDRVFMAYSGSLQLDLMTVSMEMNFGWKCGGLADAYLALSGEGTISLKLEVAKESPDERPEASVAPEGEIELSGGVQGAFGFLITCSAMLKVTFQAEVEDFKVLTGSAILAGIIVISREPTNAEFTVSCMLWGSTTKEVEVFKGNDNLATFDFS